MMSEIKLRECPFCSGKAHISSRQYKFLGQSDFGWKLIRYAFYGICNKCKATGSKVFGDVHCGQPCQERIERKQFYEQAAEAWNRREGDEKQ